VISRGKEGERFQEQQRDKSRGETIRDYSAGTFVKHFQIFFSVYRKGRGTTPGEAYEWTGLDKSFVQLGEGLFGGTPRCRGYGRSALNGGKNFVHREWTRKPKERVRPKVIPRNLGRG